MPWFDEFRQEIAHDHRQLLEAKSRRAGGVWSFDLAAERVKRFYRDRISDYATCGSITRTERDSLLGMVDNIGSHDFSDKK